MWQKIQKILGSLETDWHIPIALLIFAVTSGYHFYTHLDLGPQYTNSLYALYGFLGGQYWVSNRNGSGDVAKDGGSDAAK